MRTSALQIPLALAFLLALWGCGVRQRNSASEANGQSASPGVAPSSERASTLASTLPQPITKLTDQIIIYECPKCDRMYDSPGECLQDGATLYATKVTYICEFDHQILDRYGRCPVCGRWVTIKKAKMLPEGIRVVRVN